MDKDLKDIRLVIKLTTKLMAMGYSGSESLAMIKRMIRVAKIDRLIATDTPASEATKKAHRGSPAA